MLLQLQNIAHFSWNLIALNRYFYSSSHDSIMWPIISFWRSKEMKLRSWESGFPGCWVATAPIHSCMKIQGDNWLGKSQGFLHNSWDEKSFWKSVQCGFSCCLPLHRTSSCDCFWRLWGCPECCVPSVVNTSQGNTLHLGQYLLLEILLNLSQKSVSL